jgi:hypothetical protein
MLRDAGLTPTSRWAINAELPSTEQWSAGDAFRIDREDIANSDALLALLDIPGGRETFAEIEVARQMGIPIAFVGDPHMSLERTCGLDRAFRAFDPTQAVKWLATERKRYYPIYRVLTAIQTERFVQNAKWNRRPGSWITPAGVKLSVLGEEYGEVCRALLEREPMARLRQELVQLAAVACAWVEAIDSDEVDELFTGAK